MHEIAECCQQYGAWLHVDGVYGANLIFSDRYKHYLSGLEKADSVSFAPQKWMFVARLCAMAYIKNQDSYNQGLRWPMAYSASGAHSRGQWGIQGSRRADSVTLYMTLQAIGTQQLSKWIDVSIDHTQDFHAFLKESDVFTPAHKPEMNLQIFDLANAERNREFQATLAENGGPWVSLGRWKNQDVLRAVLLHPETSQSQFVELERLAKPFV